jgi:hypothetical protein
MASYLMPGIGNRSDELRLPLGYESDYEECAKDAVSTEKLQDLHCLPFNSGRQTAAVGAAQRRLYFRRVEIFFNIDRQDVAHLGVLNLRPALLEQEHGDVK